MNDKYKGSVCLTTDRHHVVNELAKVGVKCTYLADIYIKSYAYLLNNAGWDVHYADTTPNKGIIVSSPCSLTSFDTRDAHRKALDVIGMFHRLATNEIPSKDTITLTNELSHVMEITGLRDIELADAYLKAYAHALDELGWEVRYPTFTLSDWGCTSDSIIISAPDSLRQEDIDAVHKRALEVAELLDKTVTICTNKGSMYHKFGHNGIDKYLEVYFELLENGLVSEGYNVVRDATPDAVTLRPFSGERMWDILAFANTVMGRLIGV